MAFVEYRWSHLRRGRTRHDGVAAIGVLSDRILVSKEQANNSELKAEYRHSIIIPEDLCTPVGFFLCGRPVEMFSGLFRSLGFHQIGAEVMAYSVNFHLLLPLSISDF